MPQPVAVKSGRVPMNNRRMPNHIPYCVCWGIDVCPWAPHLCRSVNLLLTSQEEQDVSLRLRQVDLHDRDQRRIHVVRLWLLQECVRG